MRKTLLLALFTVLLCGEQSAQVSLQPILPATGIIQKNNLWNVLIINNTNTVYSCRLELILRDRQTGIDAMTATTGMFSIEKGSKSLNGSLIQPIQYNNISAGTDNNIQGLIAAGNYTACYSLFAVSTKEDRIAEECVAFDVEPLSPPMLAFPSDSTQLETAPAQFSWIPPTPVAMFDRLHYEMVIAEIKDGQKATEALQDNIPFYANGSLYSNSLNYSNALSSFEKDKWYAWQIVARDDKSYAGKSEAWVFKITTPGIGAPVAESYTAAMPYYTGKVFYFNNEVRFSFTNPYISKKMSYSIVDAATKKPVGRLPQVTMTKGLNNIAIDTKRIHGLQKNRQYNMEIYNIENATYYLSFIISE